MISFVLLFFVTIGLPFINNAFVVVPSSGGVLCQPSAGERRRFDEKEILTTTTTTTVTNKPLLLPPRRRNCRPIIIFPRNKQSFLSSSSSSSKSTNNNDNDDDNRNTKNKNSDDSVVGSSTTSPSSSPSTSSSSSSVSLPITSIIEKTVKSVTGNEQYKFGDITRNVSQKAIEVEEELVRSLTGNEQYKFGDITRNVTKSALNVTEETIKSVDQSTKSILFESDSALMKFMDNYYMSLSSTGLIENFIDDLSKDRESAMITTLQLIAFVGLTLHFVLNVCHSFSLIIAWGYTCWKHTTNSNALLSLSSSFATATTKTQVVVWTKFLQYHQTLRVIVGPILLPLQVVATFFLTIKYRDFVIKIENLPIIPKRITKYPVINRCFALLIMWLFGNCLSVAAITYLGCFLCWKIIYM